jgi:hypothetical protein
VQTLSLTISKRICRLTRSGKFSTCSGSSLLPCSNCSIPVSQRAFDSGASGGFLNRLLLGFVRKPGYQRRNVSSHSSLRTRVRTCSKRWAPRGEPAAGAGSLAWGRSLIASCISRWAAADPLHPCFVLGWFELLRLSNVFSWRQLSGDARDNEGALLHWSKIAR